MKVVGAFLLGEAIAKVGRDRAGAIAAWHAEATAARWTCPSDVTARHVGAEFDGDAIHFDLGRDGHCVTARVNYGVGSVLITYIGERAGAPRTKRLRRKKST